MRKSSSPEETETEVNVKKQRSRRKSEPGKTKVVPDETYNQLEEQLSRPQAKVGEHDSHPQEHCNPLEDRPHNSEEDTRNGTEESADNAARRQVEVQRQRLEEALQLAKERKRAEEFTLQTAPLKGETDRNSSRQVSPEPQCGTEENWMPSVAEQEVNTKEIDVVTREKGIAPLSEDGDLVGHLLERLNSNSPVNRASALNDVSRIARDQAFPIISKAFDDPAPEVRNAAAKALYSLDSDPASAFGRALREATPQRRRQIGSAVAASGLASDALGRLAGSGREKTHEALALLFLMAKAGEIRPLMHTIEDGQNLEVRLAVINLLALSGRSEIIPPFRRLAVRGSLPAEVRSAVMEAIYQISSERRGVERG